VRQITITSEELRSKAFPKNPANRCYIVKESSQILDFAKALGIPSMRPTAQTSTTRGTIAPYAGAEGTRHPKPLKNAEGQKDIRIYRGI
jgi:hypothetical protein